MLFAWLVPSVFQLHWWLAFKKASSLKEIAVQHICKSVVVGCLTEANLDNGHYKTSASAVISRPIVYISLSFTFFNIIVSEIPIWILDKGCITDVHYGRCISPLYWANMDPSVTQSGHSLW